MALVMNQRILLAGAGALLALLLLGLLVAQTGRAPTPADASQELLIQLAATLSAIQDAETGQRGYLLTGEARYLAPYESARAQLPAQLERLRALTAADPEQRQQVDLLAQAVDSKLAELQETIALRRAQGLEAARQVVLTDRGAAAMDTLRDLIRRLASNETARLQRATAQLEASRRRLLLVAAILALLALGLLALIAYLIRRGLAARRQAAASLRQEQEFLRAMLETTEDAILACDGAGTLTLVNRAARALRGLPVPPLPREQWTAQHAFYRPDGQTPLPAAELPLLLAWHEQPVQNAELVVAPPDGPARTLLANGQALLDDQGRKLGAMVIMRDVTARQRAEEALRASEASFRLLFAANPLPMWVYDRATLQFLEVNDAAVAHYGYTRDEFLGLTITAIRPADDVPRLMDDVTAQRPDLQAGQRWRHRRKDGQLIAVEIASHLLSFAGHAAVLVIAEDITARVHAEEALRASEELYRSVVAALDEGIVLQDASGAIQTCNASAERILGLAADQLRGQPSIDLHGEAVHEDGTPFPGAAHPAMLTLRTGEPQANVIMGVPKAEGPLTWISINTQPLFTPPHPAPSAVVTSFTDITARRRLDEARQARVVAEEANRAKSEFLSRMSHELRTPLNSILGFAQLLQLSELTADQHESLRYIRTGGRHLLQLINEVLEIARIEAGHLSLSPEPVALAELLVECLNLVQPLATGRAIQVRSDLPVGAQGHVLADRQRLQQVLLNLLTNAIKYTPPGGMVDLVEVAAGADRLRIGVRDTGPGIPPDLVLRLFTPFDRLGAEQSDVEGTGLGLALSRGLMQAMGGTLTVDSTVGQGSTFWVELPTAESPLMRLERRGEEVWMPVSGSGAVRRVLYIEDNLANLALVERLLAHRPGVKLLAAMQGQLGLELARQHHPDLILLDLHLPDMGGDEVLQRLRAAQATRQIPVVVMSADALPHRMERLLAAGADGYLTKPIDVPGFLALTDQILEKGAA